MKVVCENKNVNRSYAVEEKLQAGMVLYGWEVKSLKAGHANMAGAYVALLQNELYLLGAHVSSWKTSRAMSDDMMKRTRKLLMHRNEMDKIAKWVKRVGNTVVPVCVYIDDNGLLKLQLGLARGKKAYERKEDVKKRDLEREMRRDL